MSVILCTDSSLCSPNSCFNYNFCNKVATARPLRISIIRSQIAAQTSLLTLAAMIYPLGVSNIIISTIFPLAAIVSLGLRLRARHASVGGWFIEDYMIILALLSSIGYAVINILVATTYPLGTDIFFVSTFDVIGLFKLEFADGLVMIVSSTFTKLSIVYFYRRVLPPYRKSIPTTILLVFVYTWGVAYLATSLFICIPISKRWNLRNGGSCYSTAQENEAFDISNLAINFIILLRPITQAREFQQLSARMRGLIGGIILLGILVIITLVVRIAISNYAGENSVDIISKLSILTQLETSLLVIYASVLTLVSSHPISYVEKKQEEGRYEKPELSAEDVQGQMGELDGTAIVELPVPVPELVGTEQLPQLEDTSMHRSRESVQLNRGRMSAA
ncbi:hypothetical protein F4801DRAFT_556794 [Xylaria longipes]|nr:hypothetical protein F4801DRAFT_556794 [Xylaria longipes]